MIENDAFLKEFVKFNNEQDDDAKYKKGLNLIKNID